MILSTFDKSVLAVLQGGIDMWAVWAAINLHFYRRADRLKREAGNNGQTQKAGWNRYDVNG